MIEISKRMIRQWCRVGGEPGYLLITGAKVKQSSVKIVETACEDCKQLSISEHVRDQKRLESYIKRFGVCVSCHAKRLFPNDEDKQGRFYLSMVCIKTICVSGAKYHVDQMLRTVKKGEV